MRLLLSLLIAGLSMAMAYRPAAPKVGGYYDDMVAKRQVSVAGLRAGTARIARRAGPSGTFVPQVELGTYIVCLERAPFSKDSAECWYFLQNCPVIAGDSDFQYSGINVSLRTDQNTFEEQFRARACNLDNVTR